MKRVRVMVVGAGALGRHHARILAGLDGVELVAVAEPREAQGRGIADQHGARWVADFRDVMDQVDAASIVVPTFLHRDVAREFLSRGLPVLVEKPLAANVAEAQELSDLANRRGVVLQVGHVERFNPALVAAKPLVQGPRYIRCERLSPYPFRSTDIGVVHDLLIHDIDLVLDLVRSPVSAVQAFGMRVISDHEDIVNARLMFENGCVADLTASRVHPSAKRELQAWSPAGCVHANLHSREVVAYSPSDALRSGPSPLELAARPGADIEQLKRDVFGRFLNVERPIVSDADALTAELSEFVACVRGEGQPACGGREAVAALRVAERVLAALDSPGQLSLSSAA